MKLLEAETVLEWSFISPVTVSNVYQLLLNGKNALLLANLPAGLKVCVRDRERERESFLYCYLNFLMHLTIYNKTLNP